LAFFQGEEILFENHFLKFFIQKIDERKKTEFMVKKTTNSAKKIV